ncbi:MAG: glycosyltransferase [Bacteroidota bacterium]
MAAQKRILVCPLNWGLGHATRCMPVIEELLKQGAEVLLASDGGSLALLKAEYPALDAFELPGYNVRYGKGGMVLSIARQLPSIGKAIGHENKVVMSMVKDHKITGIISDNRYGCYVKGVPSIFLSHQLNVRVPWPFVEGLVRKIQYMMINMFDECWVPDFAGAPNLSGELGHDVQLKDVKYIGPLSRMQKLDRPITYDVVAVLSGPEPQRTFFEEKLIDQLKHANLKSLLVSGKTKAPIGITKEGNLEVITYLTAKDLNEKMSAAKLIVARSGYSTIMDLVKIGKPALLIPTPGQTEQEYLAYRLAQNGWFSTHPQSDLNIAQALNDLKSEEGKEMTFDHTLLRGVISDWLKV